MTRSASGSFSEMSLQPGMRLGPYQILDALGVGGMGEVYRAQDTLLGREVAIKVLPEGLNQDKERLARFEREARILASVNHPNIATIYHLSSWNRLRFLVLEYIPGETLSKRIEQGPIPWRETVGIARQMANALGAAHAKGIVHRDLKPQNIMETLDGTVKVLDFGLAKGMQFQDTFGDLSESPTIENQDTTPGAIIGTPNYMSPEQARGKDVDTRGDIWAFGCVIYEMLTGRKAFHGETLSDRIAAVLMCDPDWDLLPRETPERLKDLLRRCLEKDRADRLQDIGEAKRILEESWTSPDKPEFSVRQGLRLGRRLRYALLGLAGLLLAVAWFLVMQRQEPRTAIPEKKLLAVFPFKDLSGQASGQLVGDGMVETLSVRLARVPDIQVILSTATIAVADRQTDPFRAAREVGANLLVRGSVQRNGERVRVAYSVWNAQQQMEIAGNTLDGSAADLFGLQDRLAEEVMSVLRISSGTGPLKRRAAGLDTAAAQEQYIQALGMLQRYDRESSVDEAIRQLNALAEGQRQASLVFAALGRAYLYKYNLTRDKKWVQLADDACTTAQRQDSDLPEVDVTLGELQVASGQAAAAIPSFNRALAAQPNHFAALLGLAAAYHGAGNLRMAETTFQRAIDLQPSNWAGYSKLAGFYFAQGDYAQAARMFRRVTELAPDNARAHSNLGAAEQLRGDFPSALASFRKSLSLAPNYLAYSNIGTLEFYSGHPQAAAEAFEAATRLAPDHFQMWANLGDAYRWTPGFEAKAREAYTRAIALCENELKVNAQAGLVHSVMALCLAKTGKLIEAQEHSRSALSIESRNPQCLYHAAVIASIAHQRKESIEWIRQAATNGYSRLYLDRDPEFAELRSDPAFLEAVQERPGR